MPAGTIPEFGQRASAMLPLRSFIVSKWPSARERPIEIIRQIFAGQIGYRPDTIKRQAAAPAASRGHSRRLHLDRSGAGRSQAAASRRRSDHVVRPSRARRELRGPADAASPDSGACPTHSTRRPPRYRQFQARVQRAAKARADQRIRLPADAATSSRGRAHRASHAVRPPAAVVAVQPAIARPVHRPAAASRTFARAQTCPRTPSARPPPPAVSCACASRNHSTARASATSAGPGSNPSSRAAFSCVTHIFFRAMRTASSGTRGGLPVTPAQAVLHAPAAYATAYGSRIWALSAR